MRQIFQKASNASTKTERERILQGVGLHFTEVSDCCYASKPIAEWEGFRISSGLWQTPAHMQDQAMKLSTLMTLESSASTSGHFYSKSWKAEG
jgi:hypothetical protein